MYFEHLSHFLPFCRTTQIPNEKSLFSITETCLPWLVSGLFFSISYGVNTCFSRHALLLLQCCITMSFCCHLVTFNEAKPPPKPVSCSVNEFDVARIRPQLGGLPHFETFTLQNLTLTRLAGLTDRITLLGGSPHLLSKNVTLKWEIIWTGGLAHLSELPHLPGMPHSPGRCISLTFIGESGAFCVFRGVRYSKVLTRHKLNVLTGFF